MCNCSFISIPLLSCQLLCNSTVISDLTSRWQWIVSLIGTTAIHVFLKFSHVIMCNNMLSTTVILDWKDECSSLVLCLSSWMCLLYFFFIHLNISYIFLYFSCFCLVTIYCWNVRYLQKRSEGDGLFTNLIIHKND